MIRDRNTNQYRRYGRRVQRVVLREGKEELTTARFTQQVLNVAPKEIESNTANQLVS